MKEMKDNKCLQFYAKHIFNTFKTALRSALGFWLGLQVVWTFYFTDSVLEATATRLFWALSPITHNGVYLNGHFSNNAVGSQHAVSVQYRLNGLIVILYYN